MRVTTRPLAARRRYTKSGCELVNSESSQQKLGAPFVPIAGATVPRAAASATAATSMTGKLTTPGPLIPAAGAASTAASTKTTRVFTHAKYPRPDPSEPDALGRRERAARQAGTRLAEVVLRRRDVARRVRVAQAREHLDLAAPGPKLELAAAVHPDPAVIARVLALEQPLVRAEARLLHVQSARIVGQRVETTNRTGRYSRPSAWPSVSSACRSARSSAALSNAQRR